MQRQIDLIRHARRNIASLLKGLTIQQLNRIPEGFNNNLAWHIGHLVVTEQLLCYKLSGLQITCSDSMVKMYTKGSKPDGLMDEDGFYSLLEEFITQPDTLASDYDKKIFQHFHSYTTSFGNTIDSIDSALEFVAVHEALHLGYIMALKRAVG
jgi:hypothetical protein